MVGYIISLSTASIGGRYFAMFLMASGYAGQSDISDVSGSRMKNNYLRLWAELGLGGQCDSETAGQALRCNCRY